MFRHSAIAAMDRNSVIGKDNSLPWNLPEDLRRFKELTLNKPVIMGRFTFESIERPLPDRFNIVLTHNLHYSVPYEFQSNEELVVRHDMESALRLAAEKAERANADEIMIIGGAEIFNSMIDTVSRLYITRVDTVIDGGDAFFPDIPQDNWNLVTETVGRPTSGDPLQYTFEEYSRISA